MQGKIKAWPMAACLAIAAGIASAPAGACEINLGVVAVLSGPAIGWGQSLREAVALVAGEANAAGGLQVGKEKCQVKYTALDSKYSAEAAAAATNNLASQGVKMVIGPIGSPEVTGMKPIAVRNGMLVMTNSYAKDAIGAKWPLVFHFGPGPSGWADPIIAVAKTKYKLSRVVIVAPNDQGGTDVASVDGAMYKKNGIAVTEEYYQRGTTNFAPIVLRILSTNPDGVELASSPAGDAGTIVKQLRQAGFKGAVGRLGGPSTEEISRIAGGNEVLGNFYWFEPIVKDDKLVQLDAKYRQMFKKDPPEITLYYQWIAATRMVLKAVTAAGTATDTEKVAAALRVQPVDDPDMGKGQWIGKEFFGLNQELSFPFGMGMIVDGKPAPLQKMPAATGR